jgi:putative intracellular protease/amidase
MIFGEPMKTNFISIIISITILTLTFALTSMSAYGQTDELEIRQTLTNYIQGTSYNRPKQIEKAFHPETTLLLEKKNIPLWLVPVKQYISWFENGKVGEFTGRIGEIISIDVAGNVATAKAEIIFPAKKLRYTDLFLLKKFGDSWQIISKTASSEPSINHGKRILFIVSNAHFHGKLDKAAGASFSEIVNAYHAFKQAGYTVDFVSPKGGAIPLAYINTSNKLDKQYLYNRDFMYALKHTRSPEQITPEHYKAVHYIGGSSAMYGVADNKEIQTISMEIYEQHKGIISSVCHGTAGIAHLKTSDGKYLVAGKRISGYPDEYENQSAAYFKQFPFQIQKTIEQRAGVFKYSGRNVAHVEVDGRVITGQNYLSSALVARKIIELLADQAE